MTTYDHQRAVRALTTIFALAVIVSIAHYADNSLNFADFEPPPDYIPSSAAIVVGFWVVFTAAGLAGYLLFRRRPSDLSLALLAFYSGSGLIGIGHYLVPGAFSMPWWRQLHVIADVACGIAILAFVLWVARARRSSAVAPDGAGAGGISGSCTAG